MRMEQRRQTAQQFIWEAAGSHGLALQARGAVRLVALPRCELACARAVELLAAYRALAGCLLAADGARPRGRGHHVHRVVAKIWHALSPAKGHKVHLLLRTGVGKLRMHMRIRIRAEHLCRQAGRPGRHVVDADGGRLGHRRGRAHYLKRERSWCI